MKKDYGCRGLLQFELPFSQSLKIEVELLEKIGNREEEAVEDMTGNEEIPADARQNHNQEARNIMEDTILEVEIFANARQNPNQKVIYIMEEEMRSGNEMQNPHHVKISKNLSKDLFGTALAHAPTTSFANAEVLFCAAIRSFLHDIKFDMKRNDLDEQVPLSSIPSQTEMMAMIETLDFIKYLCYWSFPEKQVKKLLLDVDASKGTSKDYAEAMDFSMKKVDTNLETKQKLSGQCTDAGGGGGGRKDFCCCTRFSDESFKFCNLP